MKEQAKNELRIFKKFARLAPYPLCLNSITKREPPEPDISCNLSDGTTIAFEVVECIDSSLAQSIHGSQDLNKVLYDEFKKLSRKRKERFKVNFGNALIGVAFVEEASVEKKTSSIPKIFDYLLTLGNTAEGKFNLRSYPELKDVVRWLKIGRGEFNGPLFDVPAVTSFADPAKERIESKFKKEYKIKSRTELLAYYELQPEIREDLLELQKFVEDNIKSSIFQRVWIYSVRQNKVVFVYPSLKENG